MQVFQTGCSAYALTDPIESIQRGPTVKVRQEDQSLAILLKVVSSLALQAVFTQTAEETKAQLFQLLD
jgi:hypothetical protein